MYNEENETTKMFSDYINICENYKSMYNKKIVILYQNGTFYEIYSFPERETNGKLRGCENIYEIQDILDFKIAKKNNSLPFSMKNPYMIGIPYKKQTTYNNINKLINNNFVVITFEQFKEENKFIRKKTNTYTNTISPIIDELENDVNSNTLFFYINYSYSKIYYVIFNNYTGEIFFNYEYLKEDTELSTLEKFTNIYNIKECVIFYEKIYIDKLNNIKNSVYNSMCINYKEIILNYTDCFFILDDIFKKGIHLYSQRIKQLIDSNLDINNIILLLTHSILFIKEQDIELINKLEDPIFLRNKDSNRLCLYLNSKKQLDLNKLHLYINKCKTTIGKNKVKSLLMSPYNTKKDIDLNLNISNILLKINSENSQEKLKQTEYNEIIKLLKNFTDFIKLYRKFETNSINYNNIISFYHNYNNLLNLIMIIKNNKLLNDFFCKVLNRNKQSEEENANLNEIINNIKYILSFIAENCEIEIDLKTENYEISFWKKLTLTNNFTELNNLLNYYKNIDNEIENYAKLCIEKIKKKQNLTDDCIKFGQKENVKKFEYYIEIPKKNIKNLKLFENDNFDIQYNKTNVKITDKQFKKFQYEKETFKDKVNRLLKECLNDFCGVICDKIKFKNDIKNIIEYIDIGICNCENKIMNNYNLPIIKQNDNESSFVIANKIRHPIVEKLNTKVNYISNDIDFKTKKGLLLYGVNSGGKSTLLKSIGISVIMAQCGLFVPCDYLEINIFNSLICQVDFSDSIFSGNSSFVNECLGIKEIINTNNNKQLVLIDELTKGTETNSSIIIFLSLINILIKRKGCFLLTTHLQELLQDSNLINYIKNNEINIGLLQTRIKNNQIIFDRNLIYYTDSNFKNNFHNLYGLSILKTFLNQECNSDFLNVLDTIKNEIFNDNIIKNSKYNSNKKIIKCEICDYKPLKKTDLPLDTHHIFSQENCNKMDFKGRHIKNKENNLIILCKNCHNKCHLNKIKINGYKNSTNGIFLDYEVLN